MSRVQSATGDEGSDADRTAFREVRARLGQAFFTEKAAYPPSEVFGPLLHAPRAALALLDLGGALRNLGGAAEAAGALPEELVELVAFVVFTRLHAEAASAGHAFTYQRPIFNHLARAVESGVRPAAIQALRDQDDDALLPEERELAEFVRGVLEGSLDDERWAKMQSRLGARRTIETAAYTLLDFFFCRLESALGLRDASEAEIDARLREYARSPRRDATA